MQNNEQRPAGGREITSEAGRVRDVLAAAVHRQESAKGPDHPDLAPLLAELAAVDHLHGDLEAALNGYDRALGIVRRNRPAKRVLRAALLIRRGLVLRDLGRSDDAAECLNQALDLEQPRCDSRDGRGVRALAASGAALWNRGDLRHALEALGCSRRLLHVLLGPRHRQTRWSQEILRRLLPTTPVVPL